MGYDVIADRQAETGSFAGRLRREKRLKELVLDVGRNADAVVANADFNSLSEISRRDAQGWLEVRVASLPLAFGAGIEAIAEQVQTHPSNVLGDNFDRGQPGSVILFQRDIEALILSPAPVIGEV